MGNKIAYAIHYRFHLSLNRREKLLALLLDHYVFKMRFATKYGSVFDTNSCTQERIISEGSPKNTTCEQISNSTPTNNEKRAFFLKAPSLVAATIMFLVIGAIFFLSPLLENKKNNDTPILLSSAVPNVEFEKAKEFRKKNDFENYFKSLLLANDNEDAIARAALATAYFDGTGTVKNNEIANETAKSALALGLDTMAKAGNSDALYQLALLHYDGLAVEESESKSERLMIRAAAKGNKRAAYFLGYIYYYNEKKEQRCKGLELTKQAAKVGHVFAQQMLGWYFSEGKCGAKNQMEAIKAFELAASAGDFEAQVKLVRIYYYGWGMDTPNYTRSEYWLSKASSTQNPEKQNSIGDMYYNADGVLESFEKAVEYYQRAVDQEYYYAHANLAWMYRHGLGVEKDIEKAVNLYLEAIYSSNDRNAKYHLANVYLYELKDRQKHFEAISYLNEASEQGNVYAASTLARFYGLGKFGLEQDMIKMFAALEPFSEFNDMSELYFNVANEILHEFDSENVEEPLHQLFNSAIKLGNYEAMSSYAWRLRSGHGVKKDIQLSDYYFKQASENGQNDAFAGLGLNSLSRDEPGSLDKAYNNCMKAFNSGEHCGDYCIGLIYFRQVEEGLTLVKAKEAEEGLKRSADLGNPCSMTLLGLGYELGYFKVDNPIDTAEMWLRLAVDHGNEATGFNLGTFLIRHKNQKIEDGFEAYDLITKAANAGHKISQCAIVAYQATKDRMDINFFELSGYVAKLNEEGVLSEDEADLILEDPRIASSINTIGKFSEDTVTHSDLPKKQVYNGISIVN